MLLYHDRSANIHILNNLKQIPIVLESRITICNQVSVWCLQTSTLLLHLITPIVQLIHLKLEIIFNKSCFWDLVHYLKQKWMLSIYNFPLDILSLKYILHMLHLILHDLPINSNFKEFRLCNFKSFL